MIEEQHKRKEEKKSKEEFRLKVITICVGVVMGVSVLGLLSHSLFVSTPGPFFQTDNFPGVWMCGILFIMCCQAFVEIVGRRCKTRVRHILTAGWFCIVLIFQALIWVGFAMQRGDNVIGFAWASVCLWFDTMCFCF